MTSSQESDRILFEQIRGQLFTSIISDALDSAGHRNQAMSSKIRPIDDALVLVGRARTASFMEV
jgi:regulator of RNase E activity RraA